MKLGDVTIFGGSEFQRGGPEDVLVLEALFAADNGDDNVVGGRHLI